MTDIRVWISDLAAYNAGVLRGKWWDPMDYADAGDFEAAVGEWIEGTEGAPDAEDVGERGVYYVPEEWAIHDFEAPDGIRIEEYAPLGEVWELARLVAEHGDAYAEYVGYVGRDFATAEDFEDKYAGQYGDGAMYAEELFADLYDIPDHLAPYIDYERVWRDLEMGDGYWISPNGHVFHP